MRGKLFTGQAIRLKLSIAADSQHAGRRVQTPRPPQELPCLVGGSCSDRTAVHNVDVRMPAEGHLLIVCLSQLLDEKRRLVLVDLAAQGLNGEGGAHLQGLFKMVPPPSTRSPL